MTYNPGTAVTKTDDTNVTLTLGGTPTKGAVNPYSLTLGWTGTLAVARGGTGGSAASGTLLDNISGFASTGMLARTAAGTYAFRTVTGTANEITVSNGSGVAGNPTLSLASSITAAWTSFTPTVTSGSGTITTLGTVSGHYCIIGKTMFIEVTINITTKGTAAGALLVSNLPGTTPRRMYVGGVEDGVSGHAIAGKTTAGATTLSMAKYDGATCIADGARVQMTGVLEIN